jgi:hypothetical protein
MITIPTKNNLIGLLGQSNLTFSDTWYQKIYPIQYIGQYRIELDWFHHCYQPPEMQVEFPLQILYHHCITGGWCSGEHVVKVWQVLILISSFGALTPSPSRGFIFLLNYWQYNSQNH